LAKFKLSIHDRLRHPRFSFLQKTARAELGSRWLADLSIPFLSSRMGEQKRAAQKTEIHSTMGPVWKSGVSRESLFTGTIGSEFSLVYNDFEWVI
jgi:hypothetical protein